METIERVVETRGFEETRGQGDKEKGDKGRGEMEKVEIEIEIIQDVSCVKGYMY